MDIMEEKIKQLLSEGQGIVDERNALEQQIDKMNRRLVEIEGSIKTLKELQASLLSSK